jgi:hypothetical protein
MVLPRLIALWSKCLLVDRGRAPEQRNRLTEATRIPEDVADASYRDCRARMVWATLLLGFDEFVVLQAFCIRKLSLRPKGTA